MNGPQFIHVVALIGSGAGVHKRKHTGYQQRGFMMGYRIRPGKKGTSFAILSLAIAEKERIGSGISMIEVARLPDKAPRDNTSAIDAGT
ncbi:hypothetical protein SDC9_73604 [bioreactor metagenome]|uniref:Uncharacterized protein n=1 Tax=bioreactor metagenome TaxID=1076179 RepID=A0A644YFI1_9ZZZZ